MRVADERSRSVLARDGLKDIVEYLNRTRIEIEVAQSRIQAMLVELGILKDNSQKAA